MRTRALLMGLVTAAATAVAAPGLSMASSAPPPADEPETMIVGGHDATEKYSWMVSLQQRDQHFCGGSLIKPQWVLTAAHCVQGTNPSQINVRIGSNDRTSGGTEAGVSKITVHPDYGTGSGTSDIALVKLDRAVQNTPIRIAESAGDAGQQTRILGWGLTCPTRGCGQAPKTLQALDTKIVEAQQCSGGGIAAETEICTGSDKKGANACFGDSGGPQIKGTNGNWKLIGVTSRLGGTSPKCGADPSIYTDATAYTRWIAQNTGA